MTYRVECIRWRERPGRVVGPIQFRAHCGRNLAQDRTDQHAKCHSAWNLTGEFLYKYDVLLCVCIVLFLASLPGRPTSFALMPTDSVPPCQSFHRSDQVILMRYNGRIGRPVDVHKQGGLITSPLRLFVVLGDNLRT